MYEFGKLLYFIKEHEPSLEEKDRMLAMTDKERLEWKCQRMNSQLSPDEKGQYVIVERDGELKIEWKGEQQ